MSPQNATGGFLWKSTDGGSTWQNASSTLASVIYSLAVDPKNTATIYAGTDAGVIKSIDGGQTWTSITPSIGRTTVLALDVQNPDRVYAAGSFGLFAIAPAVPAVTALTFDPATVASGGSFTATFTGSNLTAQTYFDVQVRAPGAASDIVALNWQTGSSSSHNIVPGVAADTWTITGVRAHQDSADHSGAFTAVSVALTVLPN